MPNKPFYLSKSFLFTLTGIFFMLLNTYLPVIVDVVGYEMTPEQLEQSADIGWRGFLFFAMLLAGYKGMDLYTVFTGHQKPWETPEDEAPE